MADSNMFGGGNVNSLYVPMSEIEQETISRLIEAGDLRINIVGWGYVDNLQVTFGDARVRIPFRMNFSKPAVQQPCYYFDMELCTGSGRVLYKERQSTLYGGKPIGIVAGMYLDLVWDIAIRSIDPQLVRDVLPGTTGLTSRLQDKDTGNITLTGNMRLNSTEKAAIALLRRGEAASRRQTAARADHATKKATGRK